jgi:hypothetical protein
MATYIHAHDNFHGHFHLETTWQFAPPLVGGSNGNDIEAKRNEASIIRHFFYQIETNKLILKL